MQSHRNKAVENLNCDRMNKMDRMGKTNWFDKMIAPLGEYERGV